MLTLLLFTIAFGLLWLSFQYEKALPQDGYVLTFDRAYPYDSLQKANLDQPLGPTAVTYDSNLGDIKLRMVQGNLAYQMNLPILTGHMDLSSYGQVILSREAAIKTYGTIECVGSTYTLLGRNWTVTGVLDTSGQVKKLSQAQGIGKVLEAITGAPKRFVLSRWGLGVNNMPTQHTLNLSKNASAAETQVNIWLSYDPTLLNTLPWQLSQWARSTNPIEDAQYMSGVYALNGIGVTDATAHITMTERFRGFGVFLALLAGSWVVIGFLNQNDSKSLTL